MITYRTQGDGSIRVLLEGKAVGTIRCHGVLGWQYRPRGGKANAGEYFISLEECKRSLEDDDTPSTATGRAG